MNFEGCCRVRRQPPGQGCPLTLFITPRLFVYECANQCERLLSSPISGFVTYIFRCEKSEKNNECVFESTCRCRCWTSVCYMSSYLSSRNHLHLSLRRSSLPPLMVWKLSNYLHCQKDKAYSLLIKTLNVTTCTSHSWGGSDREPGPSNFEATKQMDF